jgi:hypothetical protein
MIQFSPRSTRLHHPSIGGSIEMAHCQHLDREAKDSYEDAPSTNDSDESVATLPSGHKSDHRYFYHNAEQEANNDPRRSQGILGSSRPEAQPYSFPLMKRDVTRHYALDNTATALMRSSLPCLPEIFNDHWLLKTKHLRIQTMLSQAWINQLNKFWAASV